MSIKTVVAALIWSQGKILIANRKDGLGWEFPGGKVEPGETEREALVREIKEELNLDAAVHELYEATVFEYPKGLIFLKAYRTTVEDIRGMELREHTGYQFHTPQSLASLETLAKLLPADRPIAREIAREFS